MENNKKSSSEELVMQLINQHTSKKSGPASPVKTAEPESAPEASAENSPVSADDAVNDIISEISKAADITEQEAPAALPAEENAEDSAEEPSPSPVKEEPAPVSAADIFGSSTATESPAPAPAKAPVHTEPPKPASPYDDLDGISQTQIHKRRTQQQQNHKGRKKKKKGGMRAIRSIILTVFILGISIALAFVIIIYGKDVLGVNNDNTTKIVTIPQGANTQQIAEVLESEGIITYPKLFKIMAGFSGKDAYFTAGDHELRPDMAYDTIFENLASPSLGSKDVVNIAFPEGITLIDAAELLEEQEVCDADEFIDYFNNKFRCGLAYEQHLPSFTSDKFYAMEGYLFPDTYQFYTNMDVDLVCQKILRNFNDKITDRDYARMNELGISLDETIILASIIQREAGSLDQMTRISSVFWNRLNKPDTFPKLQSDPTGGYVEDVIKPHIDSYNQEMFNSYDTYICNGLPAGAICNPGYDAISAALYPAKTQYYYFYSNLNTMETYFAETLKEHEANIKMVEGHQYTGPAQTLPPVTTPPVEVGVGEGDATITTVVTTTTAQ